MFGKYTQIPVQNKFGIAIEPKPLVKWEICMVHLKITNNKIFQNFSITIFDQFGVLCNLVYLTKINKHGRHFFEKSQRCLNKGFGKVFRYRMEKKCHLELK